MMKNKILSTIICILIISSFLISISHIKSQDIKIETLQNATILYKNNEIIDQKQLLYDGEKYIHRDILVAQSFIPSLTPLTKIQVKIRKLIDIDDPIEILIKKSLTGSIIASHEIPSSQIPYYTFWVEFDFSDFEVNVGETYYMILKTNSPSGKSYRWLDQTNRSGDPYVNGEQWISYNNGDDWFKSDEDFNVDSTFITYSYFSVPDLFCDGFFNWTDINPGSQITGNFNIRNIGTPLSYLNWEIINWPSWGVWTINPLEGDNLKPEDGLVNIQISLRAPNLTNSRYQGQITIVNKDDNNDFCNIEAFLTTPKIQEANVINQKEFLTTIDIINMLHLIKNINF